MNKDKEYVKIFWYDCHFINCDNVLLHLVFLYKILVL